MAGVTFRTYDGSAPPAVSSISPSVGTVGAPLTITVAGSNLGVIPAEGRGILADEEGMSGVRCVVDRAVVVDARVLNGSAVACDLPAFSESASLPVGLQRARCAHRPMRHPATTNAAHGTPSPQE